MHRDEAPTPPRQINPKIPVSLERILLKVLAKEPAARYRSADQFGQVLSTFIKPSDSVPIAEVAKNQVLPIQQPASKPRVRTIKDDEIPSGNIDWIAIGLGFLALVAVGGLIPYWTYVIMFINSINP
jgi:serine/threonine-protein kinase